MNTWLRLAVCLLYFLATYAQPSMATEPYLVRDLNTAPLNEGSEPDSVIDLNGVLYFSATSAGYGRELWVSDGTGPGTRQVKDLCTGDCSSNPGFFVTLGNELYFTANDGVHGTAIWKSDGSESGTELVQELSGLAPNATIQRMTSAHGGIYFEVSIPGVGSELWYSDGTFNNARFMFETNDSPYFTNQSYLLNVNEKLYVITHIQNNSILSKLSSPIDSPLQLCAFLTDLGWPSISQPVAMGNQVYFAANDGIHGNELWKTDGTTQGTALVADIVVGNSGSYPLNLVVSNDRLFFSINTLELWQSDGSETGTSRVWTPPGGPYSYIKNLMPSGSRLFFSYDDGIHGEELWQSDGASTSMVGDLNVGADSSTPTNFTTFNGSLYFNARDSINGGQLWRSDGTSSGTQIVKIISHDVNGNGPYIFTISNGSLFFSADDGTHGRELWKSFGSATDTLLVKDINSSITLSSSPSNFTRVQQDLYLTTSDQAAAWMLWKSDGTSSGTTSVASLNSPGSFTGVGSTLFFVAGSDPFGFELWKSDGTPSGTVILKDINPGSASSSISNLTAMNGSLFFSANDGVYGNELWVSDGTSNNTKMVKDIGNGVIGGDKPYELLSSDPTSLTPKNGLLFFAASDSIHGRGLWKSDGTDSGTQFLKAPCPSMVVPDLSIVSSITNTVNNLFFISSCQGTPSLWKSDGTEPGTIPVKNFALGYQAPSYLTNVNGTLFFTLSNGPGSHELWKSDGTDGGTTFVFDPAPGMTSGFDTRITSLTAINDLLYFIAWDSANGHQLWRSDGTPAGTFRLTSFHGFNSYFIWDLVPHNGILYFKAPDTGNRLWKSDGTLLGTTPAYTASFPQDISNILGIGNTIFFRGNNPINGYELYAMNESLTVNSNSEFTSSETVSLSLTCPYTSGCSSMWISNSCLFDTGSWEQFVPVKTWLLNPGDGRKDLCVKYRDLNLQESMTYHNTSITLDTTAPETSFDSIVPSTSPTPIKTATFSFSSNEIGSTYQCWLDFNPAGYQSCSSPASFELFQGSHIFRVRAVDPAGNVDTTPAIHEWTIVDDLGGSALAWGNNDYGQLGIGTADFNAHPLISGITGPVGFIQIDGGYRHTVALRNDGSVWVWGNNDKLQLGRIGSNSYKPVQAPGLSDIVAIDAGTSCTTALHKNGTVWEWGYCGNNIIATPSQVLGIDEVTAVSTGDHHSLALRKDGTVWAWGQDLYGELGLGKFGFIQKYPTIIPGLSGVTSISAGSNHSLALRGSDSKVLAWGGNGFGQLGSGNTQNYSSPHPVDQSNGAFIAIKICAGPYSSIAIDESGKYWSWGSNIFSNLGLEPGPLRYSPMSGSIPGETIIDVAAGYDNAIFLSASGTVWTVGTNWSGQIGRGLYDNDFHWIPEKVAYLSGATSIGASAEGSQLFAIRSTWIATTIDPLSVSGHTSLAIGLEGSIHISYITQFNLGYMTNSGGNWLKTIIPKPERTIEVSTASIANDSNGFSHICAMTKQDGNGWASYYFTNKSGTWGSVYLDGGSLSTNQECNVAVAQDNSVFISYYGVNSTNSCGGIKLARIGTDGTLLDITPVEDGCLTGNRTGRYSSLAVDTDGSMHISYIDESLSALKYVSGTANPLTLNAPRTIYDYPGSVNAQWTSLAILDGKPSISYTEMTPLGYSTSFSVNFMRFNGTSWDTSTVDSTGKAGMDGTSLVYVGNTPYISYYDGANEDLKIAYYNGIRWAYAAVDTEGKVGQFSSLAVDKSGSLHVSYWDNTTTPPQQHLKYATNIDVIKPEGSLQISNSAFTKTPEISLNLTCNDGFGIGCWQVVLSIDKNFKSDQAIPFAQTVQYLLPSGDGPNTVYAIYRDAANNWSGMSQTDVFLDTVVPVGNISINSAAAFTRDRFVQLSTSCSDPGGANASGCDRMKFSTDGSTYQTSLLYSTESSIFLPANDGSKTVKAIYLDKAGNESIAYSASVTLDQTPPTTTPSQLSGEKTTAISVLLGCNDGSGSGCASTYYTLDGSIPSVLSTRYTGPIAISGLTSQVVLKYFSLDNLGNPESYKSETYDFVSGYTTLTLDTQPTLQQAGLLDVAGKLTRYPDSQATPNNGMDLSGLPIKLTITGPPDSPCKDGCYEYTTTYSTLGHYKFTNLNNFSFKGSYMLKADFMGTGLHQPSRSSNQSILVGASAGYAIIVQGKVEGDAGLESHNKTTNRIYETLKERGFVDDNIMYFNYAGIMAAGVDAVPVVGDANTVNTIRWAVETWAKERMNGSPAPLYVIFVDHGNNNTFYIDPDTISPGDLNGWLNTLEGGLNTVAKREKRIIILGACYSGSFLDTLKQEPVPGTNAGRIVISSAAANEQSYKGPNEPDGIRGGEFFIEEFFKQLRKGFSIKAAFVEAAALTRTFTSQGSGSSNAVNGYNDTAVQHPLLEDDGTGAGSNTIVDGTGDGVESASIHLGFGVTNAALGPADLKAVTPTYYLPYDQNSTLTPLWSEPYSNSAVSSAWFEMKAPSKTLAGVPGTNQLALDLPTTRMYLQESGKWEPAADKAPIFPTAGKYEIYYFTKSTNAEISEMKRSLVYRNKLNNQKPNAFNLVSPGSGGVEEQTRTELNFVWDATGDPDGDNLTYTLQIATDAAFSVMTYQREEIGENWLTLDKSAGLKDKTSYYWRVLAVDQYGESRTSSQVWRFKTDDTNGLPAQIIGSVVDGLDKPVPGAVVAAVLSGGGVKAQASAASGAYAMLPAEGTYTITVTAPGFLPAQSASFTVASGSVYNVPKITLSAEQATLRVSVIGSGRVYQNPNSVIDCTSSDNTTAGCHTTAANGTPFSLIATSTDWRYLFSSWAGISCDGGSNTATICSFTLNSSANVTATFGLNYQAKISTEAPYASLQDALGDAGPGTTVKARVYTFQESILFDRLDDALVHLEGGLASDYATPAGRTTVNGSFRVKRGTIKINKGTVDVR